MTTAFCDLCDLTTYGRKLNTNPANVITIDRRKRQAYSGVGAGELRPMARATAAHILNYWRRDQRAKLVIINWEKDGPKFRRGVG